MYFKWARQYTLHALKIKYTLTTCTLTNCAPTMPAFVSFIQRYTPESAMMWNSNYMENRLGERCVNTIFAFMGFLKRNNIYEIATFHLLSIMCYCGRLLCWCFSFFLTMMLLKPTHSCLHVGNINLLHTKKLGLTLQRLRVEKFQLIFLSSSFKMVSPAITN